MYNIFKVIEKITDYKMKINTSHVNTLDTGRRKKRMKIKKPKREDQSKYNINSLQKCQQLILARKTKAMAQKLFKCKGIQIII